MSEILCVYLFYMYSIDSVVRKGDRIIYCFVYSQFELYTGLDLCGFSLGFICVRTNNRLSFWKSVDIWY